MIFGFKNNFANIEYSIEIINANRKKIMQNKLKV
jgi:hypothetical protein